MNDDELISSRNARQEAPMRKVTPIPRRMLHLPRDEREDDPVQRLLNASETTEQSFTAMVAVIDEEAKMSVADDDAEADDETREVVREALERAESNLDSCDADRAIGDLNDALGAVYGAAVGADTEELEEARDKLAQANSLIGEAAQIVRQALIDLGET